MGFQCIEDALHIPFPLCRIYFCSSYVFLLPVGLSTYNLPLSGIALGWEELFCSSLAILAGIRLHPMAEQGQGIWPGPQYPTLKGIPAPELHMGSAEPLLWSPSTAHFLPLPNCVSFTSPKVLIRRVLANTLPAHRSPSEKLLLRNLS